MSATATVHTCIVVVGHLLGDDEETARRYHNTTGELAEAAFGEWIINEQAEAAKESGEEINEEPPEVIIEFTLTSNTSICY